MNAPQLCVVIPALNEARFLAKTLARVRIALPNVGIVVADGGSTDGTVEIAQQFDAELVQTAGGRGVQCRAGAAQSASDWLLFLHADTLVPRDGDAVFRAFSGNRAALIGTFRVQFAGATAYLNRLAAAASCGDSVFTRFGDQGILLRRSFYEALGGFPPWPLFEDVALLRQARKLSLIRWLPAQVVTSARRFRTRGYFRQRRLNLELMVRYLAGASPFALASRYRTGS